MEQERTLERINKITLSGEDATNFANAYYRPTRQQMLNSTNILDQIESKIVIRSTSDGFEADIDGLDLSFIKDAENKENHNENNT